MENPGHPRESREAAHYSHGKRGVKVWENDLDPHPLAVMAGLVPAIHAFIVRP